MPHTTIKKSLTHYDREVDTYIAHASDVGLPPGYWPELVVLFDYPEEGDLLFKSHVDRFVNGSISGVHYYTSPGSRVHLLIFND